MEAEYLIPTTRLVHTRHSLNICSVIQRRNIRRAFYHYNLWWSFINKQISFCASYGCIYNFYSKRTDLRFLLSAPISFETHFLKVPMHFVEAATHRYVRVKGDREALHLQESKHREAPWCVPFIQLLAWVWYHSEPELKTLSLDLRDSQNFPFLLSMRLDSSLEKQWPKCVTWQDWLLSSSSTQSIFYELH